MTISYAPEAADDLDRIWEYYTERAGSEVAQQLVLRVVRTLARLIAKNPRAGRLRPELGPSIRSFPVLAYVVFHGIDARRVYVQRILHSHRDIRAPLASLLVAV